MLVVLEIFYINVKFAPALYVINTRIYAPSGTKRMYIHTEKYTKDKHSDFNYFIFCSHFKLARKEKIIMNVFLLSHVFEIQN